MKALSIRQPWAWAILHASKRIENRVWRCDYRGTLLIHAAKGCTRREYIQALAWMATRGVFVGSAPHLADMPRGALVGIADVCGCVDTSPSPWFIGPYGIELANVRAFVEPIPYRGQLGLFDVPDELVRKAIEEAQEVTP